MFVIYVSTKTKKRLIAQAKEKQRSLCAEVVILLLEKFHPTGWQAQALDVVQRCRLRNNRAVAVNDGSPETIGITFPGALREKIELVARRNCRSLNAEIIHFLEEDEDADRKYKFRE